MIARVYTPRKKSLKAKFATNNIQGSFLSVLVVAIVKNTVKLNIIINGVNRYSIYRASLALSQHRCIGMTVTSEVKHFSSKAITNPYLANRRDIDSTR